LTPGPGDGGSGAGDFAHEFHGGQDALAFLADKKHSGTQPLPGEEIVLGQGKSKTTVLLGEAHFDNGNIVDGTKTVISKQDLVQYEQLFSNLHVEVNGTQTSNYTVEYSPETGGFNLVANGEVVAQGIQLKGNQLTIEGVNGSFDAQHLTLN